VAGQFHKLAYSSLDLTSDTYKDLNSTRLYPEHTRFISMSILGFFKWKEEKIGKEIGISLYN
jgi:hypothetical protein